MGRPLGSAGHDKWVKIYGTNSFGSLCSLSAIERNEEAIELAIDLEYLLMLVVSITDIAGAQTCQRG